MVKEEKVYITTDGKQYKTKKSAERHENQVLMENAGYSKTQVDSLLVELAETHRIVGMMVKHKDDWRDLPNNLIKQLPKLIEDNKNDIVSYQLVKVLRNGRDEDVVLRTRLPRLKEGEIPEEFIKHVKSLTDEDKDKNGSTFKLELYKEKEKGNVIKYKVVEERMTPEGKLNEGRELSETDIRELLEERPQIYEVEGEARRWTRTVTTVVEANDGNRYAIDWEQGLTESQENGYMEQPKRVKLEEREKVVVVTDIIYLED